MNRLSRAETLTADAHQHGLTVVMLGGAAIASLCSSARGDGPYARTLGDVDLATVGKGRAAVDRYLIDSGLRADEPFNQMNGYIRLRYFDADDSHVDVFIDELRLCHVISWKRSLEVGMSTLPLASLLLTKLQVVSLEAKDRSDLSALLTDQWDELWHGRDGLASTVANDWGLWRTARGSLEVLAEESDVTVSARAGQLLDFWRGIRFGPRAKARSIVGDRVRWYDEPEEIDE